MMLRVTLSDVLNEGAVIRHEIRRDVDSFCVPYFAVFQIVFLRVQCCQESQLCANTELRYNDVEGFVKQLVLTNLRHQIVSNGLLSRDWTLDTSFEQGWVLLSVCALHHRLRGLRISELVKAQRLQVHDVSNVKTEDPIILTIVLHSKCAACRYLVFLFNLKLVHFLVCLERNL